MRSRGRASSFATVRFDVDGPALVLCGGSGPYDRAISHGPGMVVTWEPSVLRRGCLLGHRAAARLDRRAGAGHGQRRGTRQAAASGAP